MEDLLKDRYKVIADYPRSDFVIGQILELSINKDVHFLPFCTDAHGYYWYERSFAKYPHLFRKMDWWEDRKPEEIQFVKLVVDIPYWQIIKGEVHKVKLIYKQPIWLFDLEKAKWIKPTALTPATLSEYLNQNH